MFRVLFTASIFLFGNIFAYPFAASSCIQNESDARLVIIGSFDNLRFTEDHAYGYAVEIWRQGNQVFGLFMTYQGVQADPPTGLLENIKFDPKTGKLSFRARLTTGLTYNQQHSGVPSRNIFQFDGYLRRERIEGNIETSNALFPDIEPQRENVVIRKSKEGTAAMQRFSSYAEWKRRADEILKRRGPKW